MEQAELEKLVEELESRVDRLRSLYEQYFMGLEKMVPAVAHKDVERRLYVLRRTTIRNTGLRFRFQNILLKYNTYGTYWQRIVRQIEEGTYKRDVRRAKARFGPDARPEGRGRRGRKGEEDHVDLEVAEVDVDFDELDVDVELEEAVAALASFEEEEIAKARAEVAKMRAALRSAQTQKAAEAQRRAAAPLAQSSEPTLTIEHDPADYRSGPDEAHGATERPPASPEIEPSTEPKIPAAKPAGSSYAVRGTRRSELPPALPIAGLDEPGISLARPPTRGVPRPGTRPPSKPSPAPLARASSPKVRPAGPVPPKPAAKPASPPSISDDRVRQLYTQLVETKRKVGESTAAITIESLSRSLRDSSDKLKQKYAGKNVDFEVTVKDGKAVLKPVVK